MANRIRTGHPRGFNKGHSSKFREGSRVRHHLKKAGGHIGWNVVEITIKMKTIVRKPLMIKIVVWSMLTIFDCLFVVYFIFVCLFIFISSLLLILLLSFWSLQVLFLIPVLTVSFSRKPKWQQVFSDLQDSSKYPSEFFRCCGLVSIDSSSDLGYHFLFQVLEDYSKSFNIIILMFYNFSPSLAWKTAA